MKTNIPSLPLRILSAAFLVCALSGATLRADEDGSTATVKLSAPGKPSTLRLDMPWADIHIAGVDGDTVTVESTLAQKGAKPARPGGLRRLDDEVSFEITEHDNVVSLRLAGDNPWAGHDAEFKISVPRAMALDLKTDAGGDLKVENTEGDIEITSMNGDIVLKGISGATQSRLAFLPERHTDFIFAVFAEMWGFIGCLVLVLAYGLLILRGFEIALSARSR